MCLYIYLYYLYFQNILPEISTIASSLEAKNSPLVLFIVDFY